MVLAVQLLILIKHTSRSKAVVDLSFGCSVILATITALIITLVINQSMSVGFILVCERRLNHSNNSLALFVAGPLIGVAGAVLVTFVVEWTFCGLLYHLRKSFTIGEAAVVSQGLLLFLFNSLALDLSTALLQPQLIRAEGVDEDIETVEHGLRHIIQLGILMIFVLIGFMRALGERVQKLILFAPLLTLIGLGVIAIPVTQPIPIIFIFKFLFNDLNKVILLQFCFFSFFHPIISYSLAPGAADPSLDIRRSLTNHCNFLPVASVGKSSHIDDKEEIIPRYHSDRLPHRTVAGSPASFPVHRSCVCHFPPVGGDSGGQDTILKQCIGPDCEGVCRQSGLWNYRTDSHVPVGWLCSSTRSQSSGL